MRLILYRFTAVILLILLAPFLFMLCLAVRLSSKGPFLFRQKRMGKDNKPFTIYKIRTMVEDAEALKKKYAKLNEADGPVFKIRDDPRYTKVGRVISHLGLDEMPQLINIAKGEMSYVGPRPLPVEEAKRVPRKYSARFSVVPGVTSSWIVNGAHTVSFDRWMQMDLEYVKHDSLWYDMGIFLRTVMMILKFMVLSIYRK